MALVERQSTPICSVQVHGSVESRGSRSGDEAPLEDLPLGTRGRLASWLARVRENVWAPIALRAMGVVLGMLALTGIGALATARNLSGYAVGSARSPGSRAVPAIEQASLAAPAPERARGAANTAGTASPETKASAGVTEDGKVILNLASVDDLRRLPGVGKKRAESIVQLREKLGGKFRRLSDLLRIRGIGPRRLKTWAPLLVLDPPPAKAVPSGSPSSNASATQSPSVSANASSTSPQPTVAPDARPRERP